MGKFKNRAPEKCAYRHCENEFRPKRELQRFCSKRCREAYHYDEKRRAQGLKKPRKRHLRTGTLGSMENGEIKSTKTAIYRDDVSIVKATHSIEVPSTSDIDPELLRVIVRMECGEQ